MDFIPAEKGDDIFVTLGSNIRRVRVSRRIYRKTMATALGLSMNQLTSIERGESDPDIVMIVKIAQYFDLNPSALLHKTAGKLEPESGETSSQLSTTEKQQCIKELETLSYRLADCCDAFGDTFDKLALEEEVRSGAVGAERLKSYADEQRSAAAEIRRRLKSEEQNIDPQ